MAKKRQFKTEWNSGPNKGRNLNTIDKTQLEEAIRFNREEAKFWARILRKRRAIKRQSDAALNTKKKALALVAADVNDTVDVPPAEVENIAPTLSIVPTATPKSDEAKVSWLRRAFA